jgi:alpha-tubulin suppressor-like RCC1 family protein
MVAIAASYYTSFALRIDGTVWAWGQNARGELGVGFDGNLNVPVQVQNLSGVAAIAVGTVHGFALKSDRTVRSWA